MKKLELLRELVKKRRPPDEAISADRTGDRRTYSFGTYRKRYGDGAALTAIVCVCAAVFLFSGASASGLNVEAPKSHRYCRDLSSIGIDLGLTDIVRFGCMAAKEGAVRVWADIPIGVRQGCMMWANVVGPSIGLQVECLAGYVARESWARRLKP